MFTGINILFYIIFMHVSVYNTYVDSFDEERYSAGKTDLAYFKQEASLPKYGKCWLDALEQLEIGCEKLTEDELYRMTFSFMNCFLLKTGRDRHECSPDANVEDCTRFLKSEAYAVYTKFFTHTQNVCFFLQAQKWQAVIKFTTHRLVDASHAVALQMRDSNDLQSEILKRQEDSIHLQQVLLESGNTLKKTLDASKLELDKVMTDFKTSSLEQKNLLFEVFDAIKSFQSIVVGEMAGFLSLVFFVTGMLISFLLTSSPCSSSARIPVFAILSINFLIEKTLFGYIRFREDIPSDQTFTISEEEYYEHRNISRLISMVMSLTCLLWCALKYQDFGFLSYNMLKQLSEENRMFKEILSNLQHYLSENEIDDTESLGYGSDYDSSVSTLDQTEDRTFQPDSSMASSSLMDDVRFLSTSIPYKDQLIGSIMAQFNTPNKKVENAMSDQQVSAEMPSSTGRYDFRPRKTPDRYRDKFDESPIEFGKKIKSLERDSVTKSIKTISFNKTKKA